MQGRRPKQPAQRRYCRHASPLYTGGMVLLALGIALLIWCIPEWAWAAMTGLVLVAAGLIMIRWSRR